MFYKYVIKQWFIPFIKKLLFLSVNNVTKYDQFFGFICAGNTKQNISFPLSSRTSPFTRRLICKDKYSQMIKKVRVLNRKLLNLNKFVFIWPKVLTHFKIWNKNAFLAHCLTLKRYNTLFTIPLWNCLFLV